MTDYDRSKKAEEHFRKRIIKEFGSDTRFYNIRIEENILKGKISIHEDWSPFVEDILKTIQSEVYEIINHGDV